MSTHRTPLEVCERLLGGPEAVGRAAGVNEKRPYGWRSGSQHREAGDIPLKPARRLLAWASRRGIPLTAEHIVYGATEAELARLEARLPAAHAAARPAMHDDMPQVAAQ